MHRKILPLHFIIVTTQLELLFFLLKILCLDDKMIITYFPYPWVQQLALQSVHLHSDPLRELVLGLAHGHCNVFNFRFTANDDGPVIGFLPNGRPGFNLRTMQCFHQILH